MKVDGEQKTKARVLIQSRARIPCRFKKYFRVFLVSKVFSYNNLDKNFKLAINHIVYDFSKEKCSKMLEKNAKRENEEHKDCVIYCRLNMALGYFSVGNKKF